MALKNYNVTINDLPTVLQLSDKDAKARGLTAKDLVSARTPRVDADESAVAGQEAAAAAAKAEEESAAAKAAEEEAAAAAAAEAEKAAKAPANKSRTAAANK